MKNIIIPTDYSENAARAMHYGAALAQAAKVRVTLYHAFPYPVITDVPPEVMQRFADDTLADHLHRLQVLKQILEKQYNIEVNCIAKAGPTAYDLPALMTQENCDLAVMAQRGANPALHVLMGGTTAEVLRRGQTPLLIVPSPVAFKAPRRIMFACDNPWIENPATLLPLKGLADLFGAEIEVYMLDAPQPVPGQSREPRPSNLEAHLGKLKHVYTFETGEDVRERILEALGKSGADMLAMIPHHRSIFAYLFDTSDTFSIALQTTVPMLVLAEKSVAGAAATAQLL